MHLLCFLPQVQEKLVYWQIGFRIWKWPESRQFAEIVYFMWQDSLTARFMWLNISKKNNIYISLCVLENLSIVLEQSLWSDGLFECSIYTKKEAISKENPKMFNEIGSILNASPIFCNWIVLSAIFLGLEN